MARLRFLEDDEISPGIAPIASAGVSPIPEAPKLRFLEDEEKPEINQYEIGMMIEQEAKQQAQAQAQMEAQIQEQQARDPNNWSIEQIQDHIKNNGALFSPDQNAFFNVLLKKKKAEVTEKEETILRAARPTDLPASMQQEQQMLQEKRMRDQIESYKKNPDPMAAFFQGATKSMAPIPKDMQTLGLEEAHPIAATIGRIAGTLLPLAAMSKAAAPIVPALENALPMFKELYPVAARMFAQIVHSSVVGAGLGGYEEVIKQVSEEEGIDPGRVAKEAAWGSLSFAPWGIVPGTKIGSLESSAGKKLWARTVEQFGENLRPFLSSAVRGSVAGGSVGLGTAAVELIRKKKIGPEELANIAVNSISAGMLQGMKAEQIADAYKMDEISNYFDRKILAKIKSVHPDWTIDEVRASAGMIKWGISDFMQRPAFVAEMESRIENPIIKKALKEIYQRESIKADIDFLVTHFPKVIPGMKVEFPETPKGPKTPLETPTEGKVEQIAFRTNEDGAGQIVSIEGEDVGTVMLSKTRRTKDSMHLEWFELGKEHRGKNKGVAILRKLFDDNPDIKYIHADIMTKEDAGYWRKIGGIVNSDMYLTLDRAKLTHTGQPTEGAEGEIQKLGPQVDKLSTEELGDLIDKRYESGARQEELDFLEKKFAEREHVEEEEAITEEELAMGEAGPQGADLEEQLAVRYQQYIHPEKRTGGMEEADLISNMRSALESYPGFKKDASDEEILAAAKSAYDYRMDLRQRRKAKKAKILRSGIEGIKEMREEISAGVAGHKWVNQAEGVTTAGYTPSTFPEYFQGRGYKKKNVLNIIDKVLSRKPLTPKQKEIFKDLVEGYRQSLIKEIENERKLAEELKARAREQRASDEDIAGVEEDIDWAKEEGKAPEGAGRLGEAQAFAEPEGGLTEWIRKQEDRAKEEGIKPAAFELPELVKMARELLGKYPIVKKFMGHLGHFLGVDAGKSGKKGFQYREIAMNIKTFMDEKVATFVLAHEIGHLWSWLPDMKHTRGNILGHIASLHHYMKKMLPEKMGDWKSLLTDKDRARLRAEAKKQIEAESKMSEREIIEEIIKEIPIYADAKITADDILNLWKAACTSMRTTHPELYFFIANLSGREKDAVIKQALKGIVDERILRMYGGGKVIGKKIIKERVSRTFTPQPVTPENIKKRFEELIIEEIKRRALFQEEVITAELKRVTQWWNPFDDTRKQWYTDYRYSPSELYADAISVLLNEPEKLKEIAPEFFRAFFNYFESKPRVKELYLGLLDLVGKGDEKFKIRHEDILKMFKEGEHILHRERTKEREARKSGMYKTITDLIDENWPILEKIKQAERSGAKINPEDNPKYWLEEWNYISGKVKHLLREIDNKILDVLDKEKISQEDFGAYLFLMRTFGERGKLANPLGHTPRTAQEQLDYMKRTMGQKKFDAIVQAHVNFKQIMDSILTEAEGILYTPAQVEQFLKNAFYSTYQVLDYLDDYVSPTIIKQVGTLKPIANPFVSTVMKMISTLRATERAKTNQKVIDFLVTHFPKEIEPAKTVWAGGARRNFVEKEGYGIIKTRQNGKLVGYYVDPYIADSINYSSQAQTNGVISALGFLNSSYFRPVFINFNLNFQTFNMIRDFMRAWKLTPKTSFFKYMRSYFKAMPIARRRVWGNFVDPVIAEMEKGGMLGMTYNDMMRNPDEAGTHVDYLLEKFGVIKRSGKQNIAIRAGKKILGFLEDLGNFIETVPHVSGYLIRKEHGLSPKEIGHEVRVYTGSPDFQRKGKAYYTYNNLLLFSNAIKEGIRGDIEGAFKNPRTRSGYWWKTTQVSLIPKILMFLASIGVFGQWLMDQMEKATEYDKTNYTIIPIGEMEDGKAVYLRIPQDEMGRFLGSILWKGLNMTQEDQDIIKSLQDIGSIGAGLMPSFSPVIELSSAWTQYATGQTPYDWFRGRTITNAYGDDDESLAKMLRWTAGKMGAYSLTIPYDPEATILENLVKYVPILQRFIRVTDYGLEEE